MPRRSYRSRTRQPRRRVYRGGKRGKKYQRKRKMARPTYQVSRTLNFADKQYVKLRLTHKYAHATTTPETHHHVNGTFAYRPLAADIGGTDSPQNWTIWSSIYSRYLVKGCKVRFRVVADVNAPPSIFTVWASSSPQTSTPVLDDIAGQSYSTQRLITNGAGGPATVTIQRYMSTRKMLGYDYLDLTDLAFASTSASPSGQPQYWYWNMSIWAMDAVSPLDHYIFLDVVYYLEFFDRFDTTQ